MPIPTDAMPTQLFSHRHSLTRPLAVLLGALCLTAISQAAPVTAAFGTYGGFWNSAATPTVVPDNRNQLLGFTVGGTTFSTGVDDAKLSAEGVGFSAQRFLAFSPDALPSPQGTTFIGIMRNWDGTTQGKTGVIPGSTDPLTTYLTDGAQGLELGSAVFNLSGGTLHFPIQLHAGALASTAPAILATQMGQPGSSDIFRFVDTANNTVGLAVSVNFSTAVSLGEQNWSFYSASGPRAYQAGTSSPGTRAVRLQAFTLADFGINSSNLDQVAGFVQQLNGQSDSAFVAYNSTLLATGSTDLGVTVNAPATPAAPGSPVNLGVTLSNLSTTDAGGIVVTVALPPGFTFDSATAPAGTSYDPTTNTWNVPALPAGESVTLTLIATAGSTGGSFSANLTSLDQVDSDPANNSADATVTVAATGAPGGGTVAAVPTLGHLGLWGLLLLMLAAAARGLHARARKPG